MTERAVVIKDDDGFRFEAKVGTLRLDMVRMRMDYTPPTPAEQAEWIAAGWRIEWRVDEQPTGDTK